MTEAIAITNVKVFDGNALTEERTVVIEIGVEHGSGKLSDREP